MIERYIKEHWKDVMTSYMQGDCYYATTNKYLNELYENTDISEIDSESDLKYEIERRDLILKKILNIDTFYSSDEYDRMCPIFDEIKKILKMEWSDNIPENGILCLVSDKGDVTQTLRIIKRVYSSFFIDDTEYEWDEAIPVAPDEIMKYIYNPDKVGI